ncbi:MAG: tetratricopeptide repeat protein [Alphaproteobacteria bacterium]
MLKRFSRWIVILLLPVLVAACDTAEERAEGHYEKGLELLETGDVDRALVEFRNVFKLNTTHRGARLAYAQAQEGRGDLQSAIGQYLRLVEQYPEDLEGRRALSRLMADINNWAAVGPHLEVAEKLAPQDPIVQSVRAGLDYRNAILNEEPAVADLAVRVSETLIAAHPELKSARRVVIDDLIRREKWSAALDTVDEALAIEEERELFMLRLAVLEQLGQSEDIIAQLKLMADRYPGEGIHGAVVQRLIAGARLDEAEDYLRSRADQEAGEGATSYVELVAFLSQQRSLKHAIDELDRLLGSESPYTNVFRSLRAGLEFEAGNREVAMAEMEDILKTADPSEETDRIKVALARMLITTGNPVGARALVEEVLERDTGQLDALKLKANWLIDDDKPGDALVELRTALDQAPRDSQVMTLMARAHERAGNRDLMAEMLSLAVDASGNAPDESLRYVAVLMQDEKFLPAEDSLKSALRLQRENVPLLSALGGLYVRMTDWPRTQQVIQDLERLGTEPAEAVANELTARMLAARDQEQELERFLGVLSQDEGGLQAGASMIRLRLAQGDTDGAIEFLEDLQSKDPENPTLRFLQAGILIAQGNTSDAEGVLNGLLDDLPESEQVWLALYRLQRSDGRAEDAQETLGKAQAAAPQSGTLKWVAASVAELGGDVSKAIALYEELYALDSNSTVIANNLASLLSTHFNDDETLERAYTIARRLRGSDVAAFQDTYGWIAQRLGNFEEALSYLEPAAEGLPEDPTVQYHLGVAYAAQGRSDAARAQFEKVASLAADMAVKPASVAKAAEALAALPAAE